MLALVGHRQPLAGMVLGLPAGGELGADLAPDGARLVRCQSRIETLEQEARDVLALAQESSAAWIP